MILHIDPTVDFACKMILRNPGQPRITIHSLNAIHKLDSPITSVTILNPIVLQAYGEDKLSIPDILLSAALQEKLCRSGESSRWPIRAVPRFVLKPGVVT